MFPEEIAELKVFDVNLIDGLDLWGLFPSHRTGTLAGRQLVSRFWVTRSSYKYLKRYPYSRLGVIILFIIIKYSYSYSYS